MDALNVKNVTKKYPKFTLDNVSFSIPQGCIMGLIGENGAGKSTVIKAILDIINKDSGKIELYGQNFDRNTVALKEDIGIVFDTLYYPETLKPSQISKINQYTYKNWSDETFRKYCKILKISYNKKISALSKGTKMKLSTTIALSHKAKLLILDEPTANLDPVARDDMLDIFMDFMQDDTHSILMSSHITTDLEKIADYITFLHEGKILLSKSKDELIYDYRIVHCGESDFIEIKNEDGAVFRKRDFQYDILLPNGRKLESKYSSCTFERPTIEEIMLMYIKGECI